MHKKLLREFKAFRKTNSFWVTVSVFSVFIIVFFIAPATIGNITYQKGEKLAVETEKKNTLRSTFGKVLGEENMVPVIEKLDTADYDRRMSLLANNPPQPQPIVKKIKGKDGKITEQIIQPIPRIDRWPVKTVYPNPGALLPYNRIISYYGNLYSTKMGVLGEYPEDIMLAKLQGEVEKWEKADPATPVIPALHYIVTVAQGAPGADGKYRFRMPDSEIQKVLEMAKKIDGIVFLDIQAGLSTIQAEIPMIKKYLEMPNVHLGIDPEFAMSAKGVKPGKVIGTLDGSDVDFAVQYLSNIVKEKNIPPKILIVHRFTQGMLTHYEKIHPTAETQVVVDMDGWGHQARKINTYKQFVFKEPVQFTGFKLFYKNDLKEDKSVMLTPGELMKLNPRPIYIQYQ